MMVLEKISATKRMFTYVVYIFLLTFSLSARAGLLDVLQQLQKAYPEYIKSYNENYIIWADGTKMPIQDGKPNKSQQEKLDSPSLADQLTQAQYPVGKLQHAPLDDPGRIRYEPFFRKMYGNSPSEVKNKLTTIYWMPNVFGKHYPLQITTINSVDKNLQQISNELELLVKAHPEFKKYLENPGGTFNWRIVANTKRLSPHSFGMTIDINSSYSNYWQWDLQKQGKPINETTPLTYKNDIPWEIVNIFEKHGFIWGGKWYHYDTMHFEYRPEMF